MTGPAPAAPRRAWVEQIMGMPISIHLRGAGLADGAVEAAVASVFEDLREVDSVFSTYRPDSDISRLNRGELTVAGCHPSVTEVVDLCDEAGRRTGGTFDPHLPGPDGRTWFDPSGLVKGWATERAAAHLEDVSRRVGVDFCLNAGGDVAVGVATTASPPWRVGIEDPDRHHGLLGVVPLRSGGVATSGSAHRGGHIIDPRTGRPADTLRAATVTGPSLMWADVYATATIVAGPAALEWIADLPGYEALVVTAAGDLLATPEFPLER
ncbi:MAG TPA: FAD:protein FMN transferase [Acidimicrobiia bacterium]